MIGSKAESTVIRLEYIGRTISPSLGRQQVIHYSLRACCLESLSSPPSTSPPCYNKLVAPKRQAKILGVIMDSELRFKEHIASAATKGLKAAMALRRLRMTSPSTARRLFGATVAPMVDCASNIWSHACGSAALAALNRVQKMGAQAVTGMFRTVATVIGEAEASIPTVLMRHKRKAAAFWVSLRTLVPTHPLARLRTGRWKRFVSPLQKIAWDFHETRTAAMECIQPYTIAPWETRMRAQMEDGEMPIPEGVQIALTASARHGMVGFGSAISDTTMEVPEEAISSSTTLGPVTEQSVYTAELAAVAVAVTCPPVYLHHKTITILTSNQAVLLAIANPHQQSGRDSLKQIYRAIHKLRERGNTVQGQWVPGRRKLKLMDRAKRVAKMSTDLGKKPKEESQQAKSTALHDMKQRVTTVKEELPSGVGRHSQEVDGALPSQHTKALYDALDKRGGQHTGTATDRNGETQQLSASDRSLRYGLMRMR